MRKALVAVFSCALFFALWTATAWAQADPNYPPAPTSGPPGAVPAAAAEGSGAATQPGALPRTGASNTPSLVAIAIAALIIGLVLVLAVRRRRALARGIA